MSNDKKANLFAKLANRTAQVVEEVAAPADIPPIEDTPPSPAPVAAKPKPAAAKKKPEPAAGKRANEDYCQANAYVLKSVRKSVDRALLDIDGLDYSTLVEELLVKWLKSRRVSE